MAGFYLLGQILTRFGDPVPMISGFGTLLVVGLVLGYARWRTASLWLPAGLMQWAARVLGKQAVAQRLCGSLQVDSAATCRQLDWRPPLTLDEGLRRVAES